MCLQSVCIVGKGSLLCSHHGQQPHHVTTQRVQSAVHEKEGQAGMKFSEVQCLLVNVTYLPKLQSTFNSLTLLQVCNHCMLQQP